MSRRVRHKQSLKALLLMSFLLVAVSLIATAQNGVWTWINGDTTAVAPPHYGIQGEFDSMNHPRGGYEGCEWTDKEGKFWYFESKPGDGYGNDLWKFDPDSNMWAWMKGPGTPNNQGNYGIQGVPANSNLPPSRGFSMASWTDQEGHLWMYGGFNNINNNEADNKFNDLWMFNISTNQWTWVNGSEIPNQEPIWGEKGVSNPTNSPGARTELVGTWVDDQNNLWLFGGRGLDEKDYNDLWKYSIELNEWTWVKGDSIYDSPGNYGTLGVESPENEPSARWAHTRWVDDNGNFWMFGGRRYGSNNPLNDLWKYNISTNNWTWVKGPNDLPFDLGQVGPHCESDPSYNPISRFECRACWKDTVGDFWLFGGRSDNIPDYPYPVRMKDLWRYRVSADEWTLMWSDSTLYAPGNYGEKGIPNACNRPFGAFGNFAWYDHNANAAYIFGGYRHLPPGNVSTFRSVMWKYNLPEPCFVPTCLSPCNTDICAADMDSNSWVNVFDLLIFLSDFGCVGLCQADFTCDEIVDIQDLLFFLSAYAQQC